MNSNSILKSSFFTICTRWLDRLIGLISTVILARILTPDDYGVVAIAMLSVNLANVFLNFGVQSVLVQIKDVYQDHYNTAWTIRIIQTFVVTCSLLIVTPYISSFFNDSRSLDVLYIVSFLPLIQGFENIGVVSFQKNMNFNKEFIFLTSQRIIGLFLTISYALILKSYWALVVGTLSSAIVRVALSYFFHPMRPKLSLKKFTDIFRISQWMLLKNIAEYFEQNLQNIFVKRWSPSSDLGAYSLSRNIAEMPTSELLAPFNRALFPAFSKVQNNPYELKKMFLLAQGLQSLIAIPAAVGLALVSEEIVLLALGSKWDIAIPFLQILPMISLFHSITASSSWVMTVLGYIRLNVFISFLKVFTFLVIVILFFQDCDAIIIAYVQIFTSLFGVLCTFFCIIYIFPILKCSDILSNTARSLIGSGVMFAVIMHFQPYFTYSLFINFILKVFFGLIVYVTIVLSLWYLCKCPLGAESYIIKIIFNRTIAK